jgi:hypothetical protein
MNRFFVRVTITLTVLFAGPGLCAEIQPRVSPQDIPRLLSATAFVRGLDEGALIQLVPAQSGLHFVGCPNCTGGRQENQLTWNPEQPDELACRYCNHRYPSEKYPTADAVVVRNPRGEEVRFPYWANDNGYRYFFQAHRDDEVRDYLADRTQDLALLYIATNDRAHARRAAVLLDRFAQVFPGWCYHYDYPFQQKQIYDGEVRPEKFRSGFRTARWTWWAYLDIPLPLVRAYDWIRDSDVFQELSSQRGLDVAARIERDLFRNAGEQVLANPDPLSNMSPSAWRSLVELGRVIGEPRYVHEPVRRLRRLVDTQFFYDGAWSEGSPDYASQTVGGLEQVLTALKGYSDPPAYTDPQDGSRFDHLDLAASFPALRQARSTLQKMRLPNGRALPIHDTWPRNRRSAHGSTEAYLLPALGHACLGGGTGNQQTQFHLTWSGGYGHDHADNLSLLLFSRGREMLSDLGYTHTAYRAWTLATAAHNTVVIDGQSQAFGSKRAPTDGSLRFFHARDSRVQVVSADGIRGYPGLAKTYRRTLVVVDAGEDQRYAVDLFEVEGGHTHDYFLHGDADVPVTVTTKLNLAPLATLLPPDFNWTPTRNEGETRRAAEPHYAYGFLRNLQAVSVPAGDVVPITFAAPNGSGPGLRVSLLPEVSCRLITGENPSIRRAGEDDAKLEQFSRPFMILRHESADGRSTFVSVDEPYDKAPFLTSVERVAVPGGAIAVRVGIGERTDVIVIGAEAQLTLPAHKDKESVTFQGELGVISFRGDAVEYAYALGAGGWTCGEYRLASTGPRSASLRAVDADTLVLDGVSSSIPETGDVVRVITADGWVYPYTVVAAEAQGDALRLRVGEGPGFLFDAAAQRLRFTSFPQREHSGAARVEWSSPAVR